MVNGGKVADDLELSFHLMASGSAFSPLRGEGRPVAAGSCWGVFVCLVARVTYFALH